MKSHYRNPLTGAMWNGRGKPPEWLCGKVCGRFQLEQAVDMGAGLTHETESQEA
ncbi:H-NS histone family protein [Caballeronia sordidicola]|uniref:H-NS histone family protein n=1 Tax=Caballeronia sordidicola TaxID=196367 RepID=UPI000AA17034|nr:H-NS histone family protein [Caballeronia sordidicola]